jgi:quercetin 2,3-dioxygenase
MSVKRKVQSIIKPVTVIEGAGVKVKRTIASQALDYLDPFLLLDHMGSDDPKDYLAGFPKHPHRGIETVTYVLEGAVTHRDSIGNEGTLTAGDMQWMTSGGGIIHEEMPESRNGKMEGMQLWVNLPSKLKKSPPNYQEFKSSEIPIVERDGISIKIIAGEIDGTRGAVRKIAANPIYLDVNMQPYSSFQQPTQPGHNVFSYIFQGEAIFDSSVAAIQLVVFADGDFVHVETGPKPARFLLVSGKPLNEPIVRYGPFVMNTRAEIKQALLDLENGTFVA